MPKDTRRDKLQWKKKKANHLVKPCCGRRTSDFKYKNRKHRGK